MDGSGAQEQQEEGTCRCAQKGVTERREQDRASFGPPSQHLETLQPCCLPAPCPWRLLQEYPCCRGAQPHTVRSVCSSKEFNYSSNFISSSAQHPGLTPEPHLLSQLGLGEGRRLRLTSQFDDRLFHQDLAQEGDSWLGHRLGKISSSMPHFVHLSNRQIQYLYQPSWPYAKKEAWYVLFFSWVNAYLQSAVL